MSIRIVTSLMCVVAAGCVTGPPLNLRPGDRAPPGEAVVLGRVEVFDGWRQVVGDAGTTQRPKAHTDFFLGIAAAGSADPRGERLTDGRIRWHLPPGEYVIWGCATVSGALVTSHAIGATFEVPPGAPAVYVGTLRLVFQPSSRLDRVAVRDDLDGEVAAARAYLAPGASPARSVLRLPPAEPVDPALTATWKAPAGEEDPLPSTTFRVVSTDAAGYDGVRADSLQPTLAWRALPGVDTAGLTYDVRIVRPLWIANAATEVGAWIAYPQVWTWGPTVYQRTGLAETRHRVETPLDPWTQYWWQVRMRRGDAVGPWSTYGDRDPERMPFQFFTPRR